MRRFVLPAFLLLAGALVYFGIALWRSDTTSRNVAGDASLPEPGSALPSGIDANRATRALSDQRRADGSASAFEAPKAPAEQAHELSPNDLRPLAKHCEAFLAQRGSSALNLLAAFAATSDRRFLEQALKEHPTSAAVLYVALGEAAKEERAALIDRFKAADPNNPLPWIFAAADLFDEGRPIDAIAELREALKRPGFYTYFTERAAAMRELARQSGAGEFDAESIAYFAQSLPHLQAAMKASKGLQAFADEQLNAGNQAAIQENARLLYDLGQMFQTPEASRLLIGQLVGVALERKALEVSAKVPDIALPVDAQARGLELTQVHDEAVSLSKLASRVFAEPALWQGYFARFRTDGELSALRWVQQQPVTPGLKSVEPK